MLAAIGVTTIEDLFDAVPPSHRFPKLKMPEALSEMEIAAEMQALADANDHAGNFAIFRGAGAYHHFTPSAVNHILLRGEYYTAYTPYQPELSQGTLQAIFEYQSMMVALTGMDAANASHYDGATSLADLADAKLGAQVGTTSYTAITDQIQPSQDPAVFDTNDQAVQALKNGQIDGIVVDLPTAYYMTAVQLDDVKIVAQLPLPEGEPEQFGAVLAKDSPLTDCVSSAVDALREDGILDQINQEWLAQQGAPELS